MWRYSQVLHSLVNCSSEPMPGVQLHHQEAGWLLQTLGSAVPCYQKHAMLRFNLGLCHLTSSCTMLRCATICVVLPYEPRSLLLMVEPYHGWLLHRDYIKAPTKFYIYDPCPVGQPRILTVAHMVLYSLQADMDRTLEQA